MRVLINVLWLTLVLGVSVGQDRNGAKTKSRPNLSGVWVLDSSRSKITEKVVDYVMTIVHQEPEIRMTKKFKQGGREFLREAVYYPDGRPEINSQKGYRDPEPVTRWQGDKLARRSTTTQTGISIQTFPPMEIVTTEEWQLSPDGKTLTRTINTSGVFTSRLRYVFNRSS